MPTRTSLSLGNCVERLGPGLEREQRAGEEEQDRARRRSPRVQGRPSPASVQRSQKRLVAGRRPARPVRRRKKRRRKKRTTRPTIPPGITRSPSIAISAGSRVVAVRIETATTVIAPSAIERSAWLSTIQSPARETITARPEKVTARPEVESASARASSRSRPARALLAVAGEDEERVVDRDPDPDHRGHVGDEDRGRHLQRDEVDQRAGDDHADEAERQRQRRGGERAEDDEQDQGDDREAARLGLGEVFLGELLHPGPDRRLPGQVGGDAALGGAGIEVFAQGRGGVDQLVGGAVAAQRQQRACRSRCSCALGAARDRPAAG